VVIEDDVLVGGGLWSVTKERFVHERAVLAAGTI